MHYFKLGILHTPLVICAAFSHSIILKFCFNPKFTYEPRVSENMALIIRIHK